VVEVVARPTGYAYQPKRQWAAEPYHNKNSFIAFDLAARFWMTCTLQVLHSLLQILWRWLMRFGWTFFLVTAVAVFYSTPTRAALFFWDNGGGTGQYSNATNWNPDGIPGNADLAVHNNSLPAIQINSNASIDSLRLSDGGSVSHTAGTLTVANGIGPDNGLWIGEFGPIATSYTINGASTVVQIDDPNDGFMVGRGGGSTGTFNFINGTVNNTVGDTHIGLDGTATWNQAGGTFNGAGVQIGRFASPAATVNIGGASTWNVGLVLMADGHGVFNPRNSGPVDLKVNGPNVNFTSQGLVMQDEANLTFNGAGGGISSIDLSGQQFLLNNGELFLNNLPAPAVPGEVLVLLDNIGSYTGVDSQFDNAPDGAVFNGVWTIDYTASQVRLVNVPEPSVFAMIALLVGVIGAVPSRHRSVV
jgi:hypothetical protein